MLHFALPGTRIPGARIVMVQNKYGVEEKKWKKPTPSEYVMHVKRAGVRRSLEALPVEQRTGSDPVARKLVNMVPVYRGIGCALRRQLIQNQRYQQKLASANWQAGRKARSKTMAHEGNEVAVLNGQAEVFNSPAVNDLKKAEALILSGKDFTLKDVAAIVGENRADKMIQRFRKQGKISWRRVDGKPVWACIQNKPFDSTFTE
jgi:hypothetical protein